MSQLRSETQGEIHSNEPPISFDTTVLICDIRGFTRLLKVTPPETAFIFIENFLRKLAEVVTAHGGEINNLTGDGFLAHFAVNLFDAEHATRAINCAIDIRTAVSAINLERHWKHSATISIGVGIHSGAVAGGYIRLNATTPFLLIGDTINVAARIESLTKQFSVDILFSAETLALTRGRFKSIPMAVRTVHGLAEPLATHWLNPGAKKFTEVKGTE